MPRPIKERRVAFIPQVTYFKPVGIPLRILEEVCISLEEAEAMRLKDLEGLEQEECAQQMNISRPTFHRVLASARQKLAQALLTGKAIRIEGGNFEIALHRVRCAQGHEWDVPPEAKLVGPPAMCPCCQNTQIGPMPAPAPAPGLVFRGRRQ